ncbi:hypothetical protein F2P81_019897 [Scophthalmus maximus]|uniref:Uncharacterized protein n=1 Tax=Scophthalmus maximus TaxID=52904 RepID=A0A6A4RWJ1_SCOMX|nr:hypothetical protein F2P81_019897 [Scophthalmus maximus]
MWEGRSSELGIEEKHCDKGCVLRVIVMIQQDKNQIFSEFHCNLNHCHTTAVIFYNQTSVRILNVLLFIRGQNKNDKSFNEFPLLPFALLRCGGATSNMRFGPVAKDDDDDDNEGEVRQHDAGLVFSVNVHAAIPLRNNAMRDRRAAPGHASLYTVHGTDSNIRFVTEQYD